MKTSGKYRFLTLAAGIATACLVVFSQLFYFQAATYCQKEAETQHEKQTPIKESGKEAGHEAYVSIPSNTIVSVSNIQISDGLSFVLETLLEPKEEQAVAEAPPLTNRLFQTLFRFIIATNAP
jgi:flagellar biosynthesis component FlhA